MSLLFNELGPRRGPSLACSGFRWPAVHCAPALAPCAGASFRATPPQDAPRGCWFSLRRCCHQPVPFAALSARWRALQAEPSPCLTGGHYGSFRRVRAALFLLRDPCCRSSVVEHPLGKGEVECSIHSGSTIKTPSATTAADGDHRADDRCLPAAVQIGDYPVASFRNGSEAEMFSMASKTQNRSLGRHQEFPGHTDERNRVWAGAPTVLTPPRAA
jgi:hypothetical protein